MKKTGILMALMLLFSVGVSAQKHDVNGRTNIENGEIFVKTQSVAVGDSAEVDCKPNQGYGLSKGLFYAVKNANGEYSNGFLAKNTSTYPEDRANSTQSFKFEMPNADVEVWAEFIPLRTMIVHKAVKKGGKLVPLYGYTNTDTVVRNIPFKPIKLLIRPDEGYELVDIELVNLERSYYEKDEDTLIVTMPNETDVIHLTPVFGKVNYNVNLPKKLENIQVTLSPQKPKARQEVTVTMESKNGYIPANVSFPGSSKWWRVGKPELLKNGGWKVVYRFKVDFQDVDVAVTPQQVHTFSVIDSVNSGRVQTFIPEIIPDFPGVASKGQKVPVLFKMPANYSISYTDTGQPSAKAVYHNALENSFADEGMSGWTESEYVDKDSVGLPFRVFTDSVENKYWRASAKNIMSQSVSLSGRSFSEDAIKDGKLRVAAIASINPCHSRIASASIVATGSGIHDSLVVANCNYSNEEGWQTAFITGEVNEKASAIKFVINAKADDTNKTSSYTGPMFDDLCLLLPNEGASIRDEDVLIFTMGDDSVTIKYTPLAHQDTVLVNQQEHATVTLINTTTGEQGDTIKAIKDEVIVVKGTYDEGYAIYSMKRVSRNKDTGTSGSGSSSSSDDDDDDEETEYSENAHELNEVNWRRARRAAEAAEGQDLQLDSINVAARTVYYHYIKRNENEDIIITPEVDIKKVKIVNNMGGLITVNDTLAKTGDKVLVTVTTDAGCKYRHIKTIPADVLTIKAEKVDATTGAGTYSFTMPSSHLTLIPEFTVPISTAQDLVKIHRKYGEFLLTKDLDLGTKWDSTIYVYGDFNGNGHRITYGGKNSLFENVYSGGSVRHLNVNANVRGKGMYIGGIAAINDGIIEDCVVSGKVRNRMKYSTAAGVAGKNERDGEGGIISHCHVLCDVIEAPTSCGIASQLEGAIIRDNVFNGRFANLDGHSYMISNDDVKSTIEGNYYISNDGNSRAKVVSGVTVGDPVKLVEAAKGMTNDYPVYAASIREKYSNGYAITLETSSTVLKNSLSAEIAAAGVVVNASVRVDGNNHLESITISASDGSNPQNCPFTDNMDNVYYFSFVMPAHDVKISFTTKAGQFIYTAKQFVDINQVDGLFFLARDIDLYHWEERMIGLSGKFYGNGHTIRYHGEGICYGLFHTIKQGALLEGLRVAGFVQTNEDCGGITLNNYGTIRDCHFSGRIKKLTKKSFKKENKANDHIAAIACVVAKTNAYIDHCSATGELKCESNQDVIDNNPLCCNQNNVQSTGKMTNSHWVNPTKNTDYKTLLGYANAASNDYPVYAQGIIDQINPCIVIGSKTIRVDNGKTLDELTIIDGEPFSCTADVKVNKIIYKRRAMNDLEPWVLPFGFNRIAGSGTFEYHKTLQEKKLPDILAGKTLTLKGTPSTLAYKANEPWLVKCNSAEYVLTNDKGPITIMATNNNRISRNASVLDRAGFYVTYDSIPASTTESVLMYAWDEAKQETVLSGDPAPFAIQPFRFYLQFYNNSYKNFVKYGQTRWGSKSSSKSKAPQRHLASVMADGWQPVILDPRQRQSVTARMLDYYDVAYLTDIDSDVVDEDEDSPLSVVSLVYQKVESRMELPSAIPLLVRAKRADAEPLVNAQMGAEIDTLYTMSLIQMLLENEGYDVADFPVFNMPHYWCASFGNRLDVWPLPSSEKYGDLADYGCMLFDDNYFDQSFTYAAANDNRTTAPMSYCITVLNDDTYELLPLMGNRVTVEFLEAEETTGISLTPSPSPKGEGSGYTYNLNGQRVDAGYKGIIIQNGRKVYKR